MSIIIGADLVPTTSNRALFASADIDQLLGTKLKNRIQQADFSVFNLETPLTDSLTPIEKCGPGLAAPTDTIKGIEAIGVDLFTLANNHILDHGEQGLFSTIDVLDRSGIQHFGAGKTLTEASRPYILQLKSGMVGILACVEHEFSVAEDNKPGANPFDPLETPDQVDELKKKCDHVIVLYHGGKENYRYPSPALQKVCRKLVDKGADLVITQHSHCIGCRESYHGGTIVYGQGNFIFDYGDSEFVKSSLLIEVDEHFGISYLPIIKTGNTIRLAENEQAESILRAFNERSDAILQEGFIEKEYRRFAESFLEHYLLCLKGTRRRGIVFRLMNRLTSQKWRAWLAARYNKDDYLTIWNYIECEAHRELLLEGLKNHD